MGTKWVANTHNQVGKDLMQHFVLLCNSVKLKLTFKKKKTKIKAHIISINQQNRPMFL